MIWASVGRAGTVSSVGMNPSLRVSSIRSNCQWALSPGSSSRLAITLLGQS